MKIAVVGGYGQALTMRVGHAPLAGETVSGGVLASGPGGKGSNQAIAAARLGAQVALLTAVGPDAAGRDAHATWQREKVDARAVVTARAATMTGFITVDADGENRISIAPGALDELGIDAVESFAPQIREADMLLVSLEIPLAVAASALRIARDSGTSTILNPAPAQQLSEEIWQCVDVLTPNLSESAALLGHTPGREESAEVLARKLTARFGGVVVLTLGSGGALVDDGSDSYLVEAIAVGQVVDTAGAGDAFTAALGVALVEGLAMREAVAIAARAGAHAVQIAEVVPALPTRSELGLSTAHIGRGAA